MNTENTLDNGDSSKTTNDKHLFTFDIKDDSILSKYFKEIYLTPVNCRFVFKDDTILNVSFAVSEPDIAIHIDNITKGLINRDADKLGPKSNDFKSILAKIETQLTNHFDEWIQDTSKILQDLNLVNVFNKKSKRETVDPVTELDPYIPDNNYIDFVVNCAKKKIKEEDSLIRLLLYVGLSAYTYDPVCLKLRAESSEGKTYAVIKTILEYFYNEDIIKIGSMTPRALLYATDALEIDADGEPLQPQLKALDKFIARAKKKRNTDEVIDLEEQKKILLKSSKYIIDLHKKIFLFFEPADKEVLKIFKSIISHDTWEFTHLVVIDQITKKIITRGWPVIIECSAKDESQWDGWAEMRNRFLFASLITTSEKYLGANRLSLQQKFTPRHVQQKTIISDENVALGRKCILYLINHVEKMCGVSTEYKRDVPTYSPYWDYLANCLPYDVGSSMRNVNRFATILQMVALARSRFILDSGTERQIITRPEDLLEVIKIAGYTVNSQYAGIPKHKLDFIEKIVKVAIEEEREDYGKGREKLPQSKIDEPVLTNETLTITNQRLCKVYYKVYHKTITPDNITKTFLNELMAANLMVKLDKDDPDKRYKKINEYRLLVEDNMTDNSLNLTQEQRLKHGERYTNLNESCIYIQNLDVPRLLPSKNPIKIPENWLELQFIGLMRYTNNYPPDARNNNFEEFIKISDDLRILEITDISKTTKENTDKTSHIASDINSTSTNNDINDINDSISEFYEIRRLSFREFEEKYISANPHLLVSYLLGVDSCNICNNTKVE